MRNVLWSREVAAARGINTIVKAFLALESLGRFLDSNGWIFILHGPPHRLCPPRGIIVFNRLQILPQGTVVASYTRRS